MDSELKSEENAQPQERLIPGTVDATGDFTLRDKIIYGDEVRGDKIAGDKIIYEAADNAPPAPGDPPFQGLRFFDVDDTDRFFGREELTASLVAHLRDHAFLAVIGASGSGKSSLVRAGVVAALHRGKPLPNGVRRPLGSTEWPLFLFTPGAHPLESIASTVTASDAEAAALLIRMKAQSDGLRQHLKSLLDQTQTDHALIVVDQFEEVFALCRDQNEQRIFIDNILCSVGLSGDRTTADDASAAANPARLILTMRADFYAQCAEFEALRTALERYQRYIGPMSQAELRSAIEAPAAHDNWLFEPGLVDLMLEDIENEPGALPLLSHALLETWKRRSGRTLTLAGYQAAGRIQGAIAKTADQTFAQLSNEERQIARNIFLRLTELGEGVQDTRRRVSPTELIVHAAQTAEVEEVVRRLVDARLLTTDKNQVEVAHEALIREWPQLRRWLTENRDALRVHRELTEAAQDWLHLNKDPGALYRGLRLAQAVEWRQTEEDRLNELERSFLEASIALREAERAEEERRRQERIAAAERLAAEQRKRALWATALTVLAVLAAAVAIWLGIESSNNAEIAEKERDRAFAASTAEAQQRQLVVTREAEAVTARDEARSAQQQAEAQLRIAQSQQVAAVAQNLLAGGKSEQALLFAVAAGYELAPTVELHDVLRSAVDSWRGVRTINAHSQRISGGSFSHDNRLIATASDDNTAKVWRVDTGQLLLSTDIYTGVITGAAFSLDDRYLITGSRDRTVRIWRLSDQKLIHTLRHDDDVRSIGLHPNGEWLAARTGSEVWLWEIESGEVVEGSPFRAGVTLRSLDFTQGGDNILAGGGDTQVHLWNIAARQSATLTTENGHENAVLAAVHSPDRRFIASLSSERLLLWEWVDGQGFVARRLPQSSDGISFQPPVQFNPNGRLLAVGSGTGLVRIWNMNDLQADPIQVGGRPGTTANFSPDGRHLLLSSSDGMIALYDIFARMEKPFVKLPAGSIAALFFNRDGSSLVTTSTDGALTFWQVWLGGNVALAPLRNFPAAAMAHRGDEVFAVGVGNAIERWQWRTGQLDQLAITLPDDAPQPDALTAIASAPGGDLIIGSANGALYRVDVESGDTLAHWSAHNDPIAAIVPLPISAGTSNPLVATIGGEPHIAIWDVQTGALVRLLGRPGEGHENDVTALALSPTDDLLYSAGADGRVLAWNWRTGEIVKQHRVRASLISLAVSPADGMIAAGSTEAAIYLWRADGRSFSVGAGANVRTLHFSRNNVLFSATEGGELQLWDLERRVPVHIQAHGERWVKDFFLAEDERLIFSLGDDGQIKAWPLPLDDLLLLGCAQSIRTLSDVEWQQQFGFDIDLTPCPQDRALEHFPLTGALLDPTFQQIDDLPVIYFFDAPRGTTVAPGTEISLRWSTNNATAVYLEINGARRGVASPHEERFSIRAETTFRLIAVNRNGERSLARHVTLAD
jgi:WD40 repeat protein/energy-coupling factor transporter ATP-binding protein EcfA2